MARSGHRKRTDRSPGGFSLAAVVFFGAMLVAPAAAAAQANIQQVRLDHRAALSAAEAAGFAFEAQDRRWTEALDSIASAGARGDEDARDRARARAEALQAERRAAIDRYEQTTRKAQEEAAVLATVLDREINRLVAAADTASAGTFENISAIVLDLEFERDQLERESTTTVQAVALAQITIDPPDGPEDIIAKAQLLESRADKADDIIAGVDDELVALRNRARLQRARRDNQSARERFDDTRLPTGTSRRNSGTEAREGVAASDSTAVQGRRTVEDRIRGLESLRAELLSWRDQLRARAVSFRTVAGVASR